MSLPEESPKAILSEPLRHSTRIRSIPTCSHKESAKKAKPGPNGFERLIAQESRDRRNGNDGAAVERVLESINRSKRNSADIPDPALISDIELSPVAENTDLDKLGVGVIDGLTSGIGRILEDAKKAEREEGRRVSRRSARLAGWQGFWESVDPCMVCGILAHGWLD